MTKSKKVKRHLGHPQTPPPPSLNRRAAQKGTRQARRRGGARAIIATRPPLSGYAVAHIGLGRAARRLVISCRLRRRRAPCRAHGLRLRGARTRRAPRGEPHAEGYALVLRPRAGALRVCACGLRGEKLLCNVFLYIIGVRACFGRSRPVGAVSPSSRSFVARFVARWAAALLLSSGGPGAPRRRPRSLQSRRAVVGAASGERLTGFALFISFRHPPRSPLVVSSF